MAKLIVEEGKKEPDWKENLEIYLGRKGEEGISEKSLKNLTQYLTLFKDFLIKECVSPTS